jgi:boron transporter
MAQGAHFPLRKPPGFHWDFFLLGLTTFGAGLLGVPAPNGLIPQAPIHTAALVVTGPARKKVDAEDPVRLVDGQPPRPPSADDKESAPASRPRSAAGAHDPPRDHHHHHLPADPAPPPDPAGTNEIALYVVEQRVSNLAQGALCLVLLTRPFLHVLGLIPRGVLAGLLCAPSAPASRSRADARWTAGTWASRRSRRTGSRPSSTT